MTADRPTSYTYKTSLVWQEDQTAIVSAADRTPIRAAPPAEFGGPGTEWSPEELLVAAVEACMASTFFAVARHRGLHGATYASSATGTLGKGEHGWAFRGLALSVRITVRTDEDRALAAQVADLAHKSCFIANSLKAAVVLDVIVYES